jgi:hypothetical protein
MNRPKAQSASSVHPDRDAVEPEEGLGRVEFAHDAVLRVSGGLKGRTCPVCKALDEGVGEELAEHQPGHCPRPRDPLSMAWTAASIRGSPSL